MHPCAADRGILRRTARRRWNSLILKNSPQSVADSGFVVDDQDVRHVEA